MINLSKKLIMSLVLMIVSISLMVTVSFAWFSLSNSPVVSNIKVAIQADSTIRIAPNMTTTVDGEVINYPASFNKTSDLYFDDDLLLSPVSTADGLNWFVPKGYVEKEQKTIVSIEDFELDAELKYANTKDGGYAYIDFWVVSPLDDCYLRVCTGKNYDDPKKEDEVGSYVVQLPSQVKDFTNDSGYSLDDSFDSLSSSLRVGFLVNDETVTNDNVMRTYVDSTGYIKDYKSLRGLYDTNDNYNFMIYEPNGLTHSSKGRSVTLMGDGIQSITCEEGEYHITRPIGIDELGNVGLVDVADRLIVQTGSQWKNSKNSLMIDDMYQAFLKSNATDKTNAIMSSQIVVLEKNVPQRVRMFVWIEGQDIDCSYLAADKTISLRLELSGSTGS